MTDPAFGTENTTLGETSPADRPGDWYVISTLSGHEAKVAANLNQRAAALGVADRILEVVIPKETAVEMRGGKRREVTRNLFPGYVLVRMYGSDETFGVVATTPGVLGFAGGDTLRPTPLTRRDIEKLLGGGEEGDRAAVKKASGWQPGDKVKVVAGAFSDYDAVISEVRDDQGRVVAIINIFGRDTPVELAQPDIVRA